LVVETVITFDSASIANNDSDATAKSNNELVVMSKSNWHPCQQAHVHGASNTVTSDSAVHTITLK